MRSLTELSIKVDADDDPDHAYISVESAIYEALHNPAEFGSPSDEQICAAAAHMAGILARLFVGLTPVLATDRRACGCGVENYKPNLDDVWTPRIQYQGCDVVACAVVVSHDDISGSGQDIWFGVPKAKAKTYLRLVESLLTDIAEVVPAWAATG